MTANDDTTAAVAQRFVGRRVVVAAFGDGLLGAALGRTLVDAGVEVHLVTTEPPDRNPGFASVTGCDELSLEAIDDSMARIGAVVQDVLVCGDVESAEGVVFAALARAARPLMRVGGAIAAAASPAVDAFVHDHGADFATDGIRLVAVPMTSRGIDPAVDGMLRAALPGLA